MDPVLRSLAIYTFLLVVFRLAGKRTLADITPFDLVLLLIIGEATSQGLLGDEHSVTNAVVVVTTLVVVDVLLSLAKQHVPALARVTEGGPSCSSTTASCSTSAWTAPGSTSTTCSKQPAPARGSAPWPRSATPSSSATA